MPLNKKGRKILKRMKEQYGPEKGKSVFYASINSGEITDVEERKYNTRRPKRRTRKVRSA